MGMRIQIVQGLKSHLYSKKIGIDSNNMLTDLHNSRWTKNVQKNVQAEIGPHFSSSKAFWITCFQILT